MYSTSRRGRYPIRAVRCRTGAASCKALPQIAWLKTGCPTCYTYVYDDETSTFTGDRPASTSNASNATSYTITFCPDGVSVPAD